MSHPCVTCAGNGTSCCEGTQIGLTTGDVQRIATFLGHDDFFHLETAEPDYLDVLDDPDWVALTVRPDGRRRVLKRTPGKRCGMLTDLGCQLPWDVRPLICRLHPYTYTEAGISGIAATCPISGHAAWPIVLTDLGMAVAHAQEWHRLLYAELRAEPRSTPDDRIGCAAPG